MDNYSTYAVTSFSSLVAISVGGGVPGGVGDGEGDWECLVYQRRKQNYNNRDTIEE